MYLVAKRSFDIIVSTVFLVILLPILLPIMILLKFTGEGYVFYKQKRIGQYGKPFFIIKFATMLKNSPNIGTGAITLRDDPRLLPFGKFLRMTKINELPQIFNVIKGDMSLVGPRPLVEKMFNFYSSESSDLIFRAAPGITGIGSIIFRDEELLISSSGLHPDEFYKLYITPYKAELELWYLRKRSMLVDLKILFLTIWVIIFPRTQLMLKLFKDLPSRPQIKVADANL